MTPKDVSEIIPRMSIWHDYNKEIVALWTARALAESGNIWRKISWEEIEPMVSEWGKSEKLMFKMFLPILDSEEKARSISPLWRDIP